MSKVSLARLRGLRRADELDLVFVTAEANRGWILDGICRDTAAQSTLRTGFHYDVRRLPRARAYFFSHYSLYFRARALKTIPKDAATLVYYTHPRDIGVERTALVEGLSACTQVLSMASLHGRQLQDWGVPSARITTMLGAADETLFQRLEERNGGGAVGLVSAYYERKEPQRILDVASLLPDRKFLLVGRDWQQAPFWPQLDALPNLEVVEAPYADYPGIYRQMDVFLSPSTLEGGPIPLIEAMMTNVVPVCTSTGFAPDLIEHGVNGFLAPTDTTASTLADYVKQAYAVQADVRPSIEHLTWRRYAEVVESFVPGRS